MNLKELKHKLQSIPTPPEFANSKQTNNDIIIRIPKILLEVSKELKKDVIYFALIKTLTKSDRIKKYDIKDVSNKLCISRATFYRILKYLQKKEYIKINNKNEIILKSWQSFIFAITGKKIRRQSIKFLNIQINKNDIDNSIFNIIKKVIYSHLIKKEIKAQKYYIDKKVSQIGIKEKYLSCNQNKIKKILNSKSDSIQKGAVLRRTIDKLNQISNKYLRHKYHLSEQEFKEIKNNLSYASILNIIITDNKQQDVFFVWLTSKAVAKRFKVSERQSNNLLNEFGYCVNKLYLNKSEQTITGLKKAFLQDNFYLFGNKCLFLRNF